MLRPVITVDVISAIPGAYTSDHLSPAVSLVLIVLSCIILSLLMRKLFFKQGTSSAFSMYLGPFKPGSMIGIDYPVLYNTFTVNAETVLKAGY